MAKEYAYDYSYYTSAAQPAAYPYKGREQERETAVPKIKRRAKAKKSRLNQALSVILIAAVFVVVFRYTVINEMNYNNTKLTNELRAVTAETDVAKISLDRTTDLKYVENVAKTKLGMDFPQNHQVVNVTLSHPNKAVAAAGEKTGFFTSLKNIFGSVLEYLY